MLVGRGRDCCARYGDRVYAVARGKHNTQRLGKIFGGNRLDADSPPSYVLRHLTIRYVLRVTSLRRASHQRHSTTADQADVADHLVKRPCSMLKRLATSSIVGKSPKACFCRAVFRET